MSSTDKSKSMEPHLVTGKQASRREPRRWAAPWRITVVVTMLAAWIAVSEAAEQYSVELFRRGPSLSELIVASDTKAIPPARIFGSYNVSDGTNVFYVSEYIAQSDRHNMELRTAAATYSAYVVGAEWWEVARWRWDDVIFTCADGRTQVSAALHIKVKGYATGFSYTYNTAPAGSVELYLGHPQYLYNQGIWRAASNNAWPQNSCLPSPPYTCSPTVPGPPSTGVFAGSTGNLLDQTVSFLMGEPPSPMVPTGTPVVVAPSFTLAIGVLNENVAASFRSADGGGISLPMAEPVFDLPAGCTCNSDQMNVSNNMIGTTPVRPESWGRVKTVYR